MNVSEMLGSMGIVGMAVMVCLLVLSIYSVSVILGKYRRFKQSSSQSSQFMSTYSRSLREGKLQDAIRNAQQHSGSHVARVVCAGAQELTQTEGDAGTRIELVSRALDRSKVETISDMKKGLGALATIASTAPFIGLFGTVVGIINAFSGIAESGSGGVAAVSGGISEALIATALGIFVAVPAVMAFNHFTGVLERFNVEMSSAASELVDHLYKRSGQARAAHASR
ncbi:hypothetical protein ABI59_09210 [Acidobacteria bacterium Mor1]|nr:hypothetical protein ABI59_09210 [Acidobacteria bacterium Mor1]